MTYQLFLIIKNRKKTFKFPVPKVKFDWICFYVLREKLYACFKTLTLFKDISILKQF